MNLSRISALAGSEIRQAWRRPLYLFLFGIMVLMVLGLYAGNVQIRPGAEDVAAMKNWINSEFNLAFINIVVMALIVPFFTSVSCGLAVLNDEDRKLDRVLLSTPLTPQEYAWGRFLGAILPIILGLLAVLAFQMLMFDFWPRDNASEVRGPFSVINYLRPFMVFALPLILFSGGLAFLLGTWTRQPAIVFALPTVMLVSGSLFLWSFSPDWLPGWVNRLLQWIDPGSVRWFIENFVKESRPASFYNLSPVQLDWPIALSRFGFAAFGLLCVPLVGSIVSRRVRGSSPAIAVNAIPRQEIDPVIAEVHSAGPMPAVIQRLPGFWATTWAALRKELGFLLRSPGVWLFGPLIAFQVATDAMYRPGTLDSRLLQTSGYIASQGFEIVTLLLILLLLYYTVESLVREDRRGLNLIVDSTPAPTGGLLFGKVLANAALAGVIVASAVLGALFVLIWQKVSTGVWVGVEWGVLGLIWGALLAPTLIFWSAFVTFLFALTRSRYATYGLSLAALAFTGWAKFRGWLDWATLWHLWQGVRWSEIDRLGFAWKEIVWNRLMTLSMAAFLVTLSLTIWPRRRRDIRAVADRMSLGAIVRTAWRPLLVGLVPLAIGLGMFVKMRIGFEGSPMEYLAKNYWRQNISTWKDAVPAALDLVRANVDIQPESRSLSVSGEYVLRNATEQVMDAIPLTIREHLTVSKWTLDGEEIQPVKSDLRMDRPSIENRSGLMVVRPKKPLEPNQTCRVTFELTGRLPDGWSRRATGLGEFILPSGVVLTSFSGVFLPLIGFVDTVGVDDDNRSEAKEYPDDYWKGKVNPEFGAAWAGQVELTVTGPESWTINAVGVPGEPRIEAGRKTIAWKTDHPVRFFNLVGGPLEETKGSQSSIFHSARHRYNVDKMVETLDGARKYYSQWFHPYPWRDLKVTEFPSLAGYAQGFPGNISFSEAIGFFTRVDDEEEKDEPNPAEFVVAHEAAHQWWGNILTPGKGPGGNVLSEGMANYSAAMLIDQLRGPQFRRALMKKFERQYVQGRVPDSERPLHKIDGSRRGDSTVTYDRGGWVFWMLMEHLGRDRMLAGLRKFIDRFKDGPDFPLIEDLVVTLREHAADREAYDRFVNQWLLGKVLPEFTLDAVEKKPDGVGGWTVTGTLKNIGTGTMAVDIAALGAKTEEESARSQAKTVVEIAGEGSATFRIDCPFEPKELKVDPDVKILQRGRKRAVADIK